MSKRPVAAVSALATSGSKVLLVRRSKVPYAGVWSLPGGKIEPGETSREAVIREVLEETSVTVEPVRVIEVSDVFFPNRRNCTVHYVVVTFEVRPVSGNLVPGSDVSDAGWFTMSDVASLSLTDGLADLLARHFGD